MTKQKYMMHIVLSIVITLTITGLGFICYGFYLLGRELFI